MAKTGLKIAIAIILLILAFFTWAYLHLFLVEFIGLIYALISIPIVIFIYITIIRFLFKLIDSEYDNPDHRYNTYMAQGENRVVKNEMNDNK